MSNTPKITIITVVFNAEALIERTLKSILCQSYRNLELLIIDGKSTDNTLGIVHKYQGDRTKIISEKDKGIYDAMNKGITNASGDYIIFINAGDELYSQTTLEDILATHQDADVYYGNTAVVDINGNILGDRRLSPPKKLTWKSLKFGMRVSHQSILAKKQIIPKYDLKYKISADIDWTIRLLKEANQIVNTHLYISKFLEGGVSTEKRKLGLKERFAIQKKHYGLLLTLLNHGVIILRFIKHLFLKKNMT